MSRPRTRTRPAIRALLIDLSGTLHIGNTPTQAAGHALNRLRKHINTSQSGAEFAIPIRFCSNTSKESTASLRARLLEIGIDVLEGELWTSLGALKDLVKTRNLRRPFFLLSDSAMEEFTSDIETEEKFKHHHSVYDSVVVGLSPKHFNYDALTKAFRVLLPPPPPSSSPSSMIPTPKPKPLITTHRAKYIRTPDGELSLGPGPFVAALEYALSGSGSVRAEVVGKPTRTFFERVVASIPDYELEAPPDGEGAEGEGGGEEGKKGRFGNIAIIGDDVEADLGGAAIEMGFWRVLVKTGKYRPGDERGSNTSPPPDEVQESFATFVDDLLSSI